MATSTRSRRQGHLAALRTSLIYLAFGVAWILLSDRAVEQVAADPTSLSYLQTYKGQAFVAVTAALLYVLVYFAVARTAEAERRGDALAVHFRDAFERSLIGMAMLAPDLRIEWINPVFCEMLGRQNDEMVGRNLLDFVHPDDRAERERYIPQLLAGLEPPQECEVRCLHASGEAVWVLGHLIVQRDEEGQPVHIVTQVVDLSARRTAEEQLRQQQMELAHAARLITLGEMASGWAHELGSPLGAIAQYAEACRTIAQRQQADPELVEAIDDIGHQAERARKILTGIRGFARKQSPNASPMNVNALVKDAVRMLSPLAERQRIVLRVELDAEAPEVIVDPVQIGQVLTNLGMNAIEAIAERPADDRWVEFRTGVESGKVVVAVRDGGHDLSSEVADRLFESFFTTKKNGVGLGLAISRSIVESHGGKLLFRPGELWTEFAFQLPKGVKATWLMANPSFG